MLAMFLAAGAMVTGCTGTGDPASQGKIGVTTPGLPGGSDTGEATATATASGAGPIGAQSLDPGVPGDSPPGSSSAPQTGSVTVSGVVVAGVEPGCLLLNAAGRSYLLIGGDRSRISVGATVTVRGAVEPDLMSTCQQGTPLRVSEVS